MPRVVDVRGSASTPAGRSPTWWPPTGRSPRCRRRPTTRPRRCGRRSATLAGDGATPALLAHGTTVATNALLERRGAVVALVTTRGLGRRDRDRPPGPAVALRPLGRPARAAGGPRPPRSRSRGRLDADGTELEPVDRRRARPLPGRATATAVAVCLLHADLDPTPRAGGRPRRCAARGPRRDLLARGVAGVPRVRADGHDRRQRLPAPALPRLPARLGRRSPTRCW